VSYPKRWRLPETIHPDAFSYEEGFSRPNWPFIRQLLNEQVPPAELNSAWIELGTQWMRRLVQDLGANYRLDTSDQFLLVSALDTESARKVLKLAGNILDGIESALGEAAWKSKHGKHVILFFAEDDDYYQYVSYFYPEGVHPISGGCMVKADYVHIAIPHYLHMDLRRVLAHELTHNCLVHLRLPLWLNEGLAQWFDRSFSHSRNMRFEGDLLDRHFAFWNPVTIQKFWAGTSFKEPGESNHLSYSLAEILVNLLVSNKEHFAAFVHHAEQVDGGQTAALDWLGMDLGSVAGTFLGEGTWRPVRKAMVDAWNEYRKAHPKSTSDVEAEKSDSESGARGSKR
jgi:hypothetical protein